MAKALETFYFYFTFDCPLPSLLGGSRTMQCRQGGKAQGLRLRRLLFLLLLLC